MEHQGLEEKEEETDHQGHLDSEVLMVQWDRLENQEQLENPDHLDSLVHLELREIWDPQERKEVSVCKVHEESLASLVSLENLEKWVHLVRMEATEKREALDLLEHLDPQDSLVLEASLVLMEAQDPQALKV